MFKINERIQCQENAWVLIALLLIVTKARFLNNYSSITFKNIVTICKNYVSVTSNNTVQFFGKLAQYKTCCL